MAERSGEFVNAGQQKGKGRVRTGEAAKAIDAWAARGKARAGGGLPEGLPTTAPQPRGTARPRDVFIYFIHEGKLRAPAAAEALIERIAG